MLHCLALTRLAVTCTLLAAAATQAQDFREFSTRGLPRSQDVVVRVSHPAHWRQVLPEDPMALAELRGPEGRLTAILQIGRGRQRQDMATLCTPERAGSMLRGITAGAPDARVTEVLARPRGGRPAYEIRYERSDAPDFLLVRSVIVCLRDSQLLVSCGAAGAEKAALPRVEPVCRRVLDSLAITEE